MKDENWDNLIVNPLISIIVITYNSSKYVLETLESAKAQTYQNIELILSDDFSTDNTVSVCHKWLEINKNYFVNTKLIQAARNTGIPANVNRGVNSAKGEWIKLIAGDDILLDNCISDNISFVQKNPNASFIFSKPIYINQEGKILNDTDNFKQFKENDIFYTLSAKKQYLHLLTLDHPINPPTLFYKKLYLANLGGFDESYKVEDFPLYLKVTRSGYKLSYLNVETIKYRIHQASFSQKIIKDDNAISIWSLNKIKNMIIPNIDRNLYWTNPLIVIDIYNRLFYYYLVIHFGNTMEMKNHLRFIRYLSPLSILNKLKKISSTVARENE